MSLLTDILLELFVSSGSPDSDRGLVLGVSVVSLCLAGVSGWLAMTAADPLREPAWGMEALIASILSGAAGTLLSWLHVSRNESDRPFAVAALIVNVAALATPILVLVR